MLCGTNDVDILDVRDVRNVQVHYLIHAPLNDPWRTRYAAALELKELAMRNYVPSSVSRDPQEAMATRS